MPASDYARRQNNRRLLTRETGAVAKDPGGRLQTAVVYPNTYRVGMSNLGLHQLYRLLNSHSDVLAERFFFEKPDMEPLSLESFRPLAAFDLVLFSLSWELDYFNIPKIITAAGIPVLAEERDGAYPLIIAGGACIMANPAPVAPWFDALAVGEAEVLLQPLLETFKENNLSRYEKLKALAGLPGFYVPGHSYGPVGRLYLEDLDTEPCYTAVTAPDAEFGHMFMLEVQRGCGRNCRFCLVNQVFAPLRFRSLENLLEVAREGLKTTKKIGLVGPVVSGHPRAEELVRSIREMGGRVAISSLAVKPLPAGLLLELVLAGAHSATIAPEAGSERLRKSIGKTISDAEILEAIGKAYSAGFKALKLYFMAGLPGEQEEDIDALKNLVLSCGREFRRRSLSINIAPFVPKARTAFQREPVLGLATIEKRLAYLKSELSAARVEVKIESPAWSRMQAALSRGDERLAPVIASLEKATLTGWKRALESAGIDEADYLGQQPVEIALPWERYIKG